MNTLQDVRDNLEKEWDSRGMINWLKMESALKCVLRNYEPTPALKLIDEIVGAYTKRGCVYDQGEDQ